ncbi:hypothetical protein [Massilia putida]|uniref:hypothetical protein n=1 Tax=Massilia putida TaxID=1141883 RepID=UPI000951AA3E|nr:hypothetical protein [Massilia putida]
MTSNLGRKGVPDAPGLDPTNVPQDGVQQTDGADRAELQRALLVYGMAGAHGADRARGAMNDTRG